MTFYLRKDTNRECNLNSVFTTLTIFFLRQCLFYSLSGCGRALPTFSTVLSILPVKFFFPIFQLKNRQVTLLSANNFAATLYINIHSCKYDKKYIFTKPNCYEI